MSKISLGTSFLHKDTHNNWFPLVLLVYKTYFVLNEILNPISFKVLLKRDPTNVFQRFLKNDKDLNW